jgi:acetylornithine deacetylase
VPAPDGVEGTLARLVAYPTVSDTPVTGIAAYLAERAEALGMRVERLDSPMEGKCNLVCSAGPAGTDGLVLSGHMDVVPVNGQPWTGDPFRLRRIGDRLVGRGACDMKAFLAATMEGLARLDLQRLERELVLVFTHDEEVGCLGSRQLVEQLAGRPLPSLALIGEPTRFSMLRMHPGHAAVRITCHGVAAHSSRPDLGRNAIAGAAKVLARLEALADVWARDVRFAELLACPFVVMNVATIHGGSAVNIVPDRCVIEVGFRPLPGMEVDALYEELRDAVTQVDARHVETELLRVTPSMLTPAGTRLEALLRPHARTPELGAASFATDGGNLQHLGVQTLVFGPGSIEVAHKADEYVPVDELHRAVDVVADVAWKACGPG